MDSFTKNVWNWPLWSQLLLLIVLGMVANFWLSRLLIWLKRPMITSWLPDRFLNFSKCLFSAAIFSWVAVRFCIGINGPGEPSEWGFYGRVLFVGLTAYLTNLLTRYFS